MVCGRSLKMFEKHRSIAFRSWLLMFISVNSTHSFVWKESKPILVFDYYWFSLLLHNNCCLFFNVPCTESAIATHLIIFSYVWMARNSSMSAESLAHWTNSSDAMHFFVWLCALSSNFFSEVNSDFQRSKSTSMEQEMDQVSWQSHYSIGMKALQ